MNGVERVQATAPAKQESVTVEKPAEGSTAPKFGDVLNRIQSQYGAKTEKPREIKKTLGKDDFLKIMITQMKHQDPSAPFKAEQMAQQMAQFASVEQLQNMNTNITKLTNQSSATDRLAMTGMIGKVITTDRARFPHTEGQNENLTFNLPSDASEVRAVVFNEAGEAIFEKELGSLPKGEQSLNWDGLNSKNLLAKGGNYIYRVEAKNAQGGQITINTEGKGKVIGVSFEGAEPVLLVGDNKRQDKVGFKSIVRIETEEGALASAAKPAGQPARIGSVKDSKIFELNKAADHDAEKSAMQIARAQAEAMQRDGRTEAQIAAAQAAARGELPAGAKPGPAVNGNSRGAAGEEIARNLMNAFGGNSDPGNAAKNSGFPNGLSSGDNEQAMRSPE